MKNYSSVLMVAVAILWCTALNAAPVPAKLLMKTLAVDNTHLVLHLANLQQQNTVVSLSSFDGTTYTRQTITDHNGYAVNMDLNQLPNGRYVLKVSQKGQQVKQIVYKNDGLLMVSEAKAVK